MQASPSSMSETQAASSASGLPCQPPGWPSRRSTGSPALLRSELIPGTAHRLDQVETELRPEPPHADVDDVGAGVEVVSPDGRQQLLLAHRLARVLHQRLEQQELQPGQGHRTRADVGLEAADVEHELAGPQDLVRLVLLAAQLDPQDRKS